MVVSSNEPLIDCLYVEEVLEDSEITESSMSIATNSPVLTIIKNMIVWNRLKKEPSTFVILEKLMVDFIERIPLRLVAES